MNRREIALNAAHTILTGNHVEIVAQQWSCDAGIVGFVGLDDGKLVFVDAISAPDDECFPEIDYSIDALERIDSIMEAYLGRSFDTEAAPRYVIVSVQIMDDNEQWSTYYFNIAPEMGLESSIW